MAVADRDLYSGLVRLHIHAAKEMIYGQGVIEELQHHGYRIGPGTLYPTLHALEKKAYLVSKRVPSGKSWRKAIELRRAVGVH
jgi:DNA-binding PadR family transcriptional regulator